MRTKESRKLTLECHAGDNQGLCFQQTQPGNWGFHHVGQAGLELPTSGDPPTLASKVLGLQA
ncbi:hypothetical protein AAY473_022909 [Plecturocebus cupreus]